MDTSHDSVAGTPLLADPQAVSLLGVQVHPMTISQLNVVIVQAVQRRERLCVGSQNLHGVYAYHRNEAMRRFQSGSIVRIDGMPLVLAARMCGLNVRREHRITWVDWLHPLFSLAENKQWTICYCGATEETMVQARAEVSRRYPTLRFLGRNGYFANEAAELAYVHEVNANQADILIVGMGMPRQERFVLRHGESLQVPVILTSGAAIEYLAGAVRTPPRWMGRLGLEWLFRLGENPRRFAWRYLVEPWTLLPLFLRDLWRYRARGEGNE